MTSCSLHLVCLYLSIYLSISPSLSLSISLSISLALSLSWTLNFSLTLLLLLQYLLAAWAWPLHCSGTQQPHQKQAWAQVPMTGCLLSCQNAYGLSISTARSIKRSAHIYIYIFVCVVFHLYCIFCLLKYGHSLPGSTQTPQYFLSTLIFGHSLFHAAISIGRTLAEDSLWHRLEGILVLASKQFTTILHGKAPEFSVSFPICKRNTFFTKK